MKTLTEVVYTRPELVSLIDSMTTNLEAYRLRFPRHTSNIENMEVALQRAKDRLARFDAVDNNNW